MLPRFTRFSSTYRTFIRRGLLAHPSVQIQMLGPVNHFPRRDRLSRGALRVWGSRPRDDREDDHRYCKNHPKPKCEAIWFLGHVCLLAPDVARPDFSKRNRERYVSSVTRCSDEIGQGWLPAVPPSLDFNCRRFWRTGDATAGLLGARLKTLSASRGKREGAVSPSSTTAGATCAPRAPHRRCNGVVPHTRPPRRWTSVPPEPKCPPRRSRSFLPQNTINSRFGRGCGKGTRRRSTPRALQGLGWKVELREAGKGRIPGSLQLQCRTESGGSAHHHGERLHHRQSRQCGIPTNGSLTHRIPCYFFESVP
jgi:hypothetical protein